MNEEDAVGPTRIEVRSYFVRHKNALLTRGQFGDLFMDYYLHLMQHEIRFEPEQDEWLKSALAALTLHLCSRPWSEASAWTFHFKEPRLNLFVTGDNRKGNVVGRLFTEDIKEVDKDLLYSQTTRPDGYSRRSMVELTGRDIFTHIEQYYHQSEQRPARFFTVGDDDYVFITAQPQCDEEWLAALTVEQMQRIDQDQELSLLETRTYAFDCGCNEERLARVVESFSEKLRAELFEASDTIHLSCPRCYATYDIARDRLKI